METNTQRSLLYADLKTEPLHHHLPQSESRNSKSWQRVTGVCCIFHSPADQCGNICPPISHTLLLKNTELHRCKISISGPLLRNMQLR